MRSLWEIKSITCRKKRICILVVILSCCSAVVSAGDDCCKRSMWAYPSGNAIPPECELLNCTEGSIHIENPNPSHPLVLDFLSRATKTGSITIINGPYFGINNTNLEEIVHNGPGPAIHLKDSGLDAMTAFPNLSRITVKDPLRYCENWDLLVLDEPNDQGSWDWLVTIANETLKVCNNPTTTTAAFSSTSQKPVAFEPASNATKLDEKAEKRPKSCVDFKILIALVVAMVVLLLAFLLVFSFALVLFISRRRQNAKIASQLSYATQIMNLMINVQAGRDRIILETVNSDAVQVIAQKLVRKVGSWQTMTSTRLSKIKADQPLDPQKDFNFPEGKSLRTQDVLAICAPRQQTAEYTEALDKYETILKAHKAGRKYYEAPKDTSRISETRQSNKKLAKVLKKLEPRRQPAVPPKNRPKAGEDLVEKKKIDPLVKPIESVNKEKCKPLVLSTEPGFRAKFDPNYKALHDNMTILGLLCDQMQNFVEVHGEVLTVVKTVVEQTAAWNVARALDYAQKDRKYLAGKVRRSPLDIRDATGKIASQAVLDPTMFHNDFVELLEKCPPEDKKLLGMLEEENKNRALRLAAAGKNYALYHNVRTKLGDAVLPGETLADANKRHYYEQTRLREIASLVDERYHRNLPNQRPKKSFVEEYKSLDKVLQKKPKEKKPKEKQNSKVKAKGSKNLKKEKSKDLTKENKKKTTDKAKLKEKSKDPSKDNLKKAKDKVNLKEKSKDPSKDNKKKPKEKAVSKEKYKQPSRDKKKEPKEKMVYKEPSKDNKEKPKETKISIEKSKEPSKDNKKEPKETKISIEKFKEPSKDNKKEPKDKATLKERPKEKTKEKVKSKDQEKKEKPKDVKKSILKDSKEALKKTKKSEDKDRK